MRPLKKFEEFVEEGIVKKRAPNIFRTKSLIEEAKKRKRFLDELLKKIGINNENANYFVENSYDILIEITRAKLILEGFYATGQGAHEAEVSYLRNLGFSEGETRFMNNLRYFRNGIIYYGRIFGVDYAEKVVDFLNKLLPELLKLSKKN